jgi:methylthioribose-1-phosphate isomerase
MSFRTIEWRDNKVIMIDQTRLPAEEVYNEYSDFKGVAEAIRGMVIRGAPHRCGRGHGDRPRLTRHNRRYL